MYLIIDGNAAIHHIYRVAMQELQSTPGPLFENDESGKRLSGRSIDYFDEFLSKYLRNVIFPFRRDVKLVFIVFDTPKYWRKYYVEWFASKNEDFEPFIYKERPDTAEQREKKANMGAFFKYVREVMTRDLESVPGVMVLKCPTAEGDDIITVVKDMVQSDVVIWSVDTDLAQHVSRTVSGKGVLLMTPRQHNRPKKVFAERVAEEATTTEELFDLLDAPVGEKQNIDEYVSYLVSYKDCELVEIDPALVVFRKVLSGDKQSDNIPSCYTWRRGDRTMTLTDKAAGGIADEMVKKYGKEGILLGIENKDEAYMSDLMDVIRSQYKHFGDGDVKRVTDNVYLNYRLIRLKRGCIPVKLYDQIAEMVKKKIPGMKPFNMGLYENIMLNPIKHASR